MQPYYMVHACDYIFSFLIAAVTVSLVDAEISFSEGGLVASVCVTVIDGDFEREINVTLNTHNESATGIDTFESVVKQDCFMKCGSCVTKFYHKQLAFTPQLK